LGASEWLFPGWGICCFGNFEWTDEGALSDLRNRRWGMSEHCGKSVFGLGVLVAAQLFDFVFLPEL